MKMAQPISADNGDDKDIETLGQVRLNSFKATPSAIPPFSSSALSWSVGVPSHGGVGIQLDGADVSTGGEQIVSPSVTESYRLSARSGRLTKFLGTATVHVHIVHVHGP
jgi:hypothetical protein